MDVAVSRPTGMELHGKIDWLNFLTGLFEVFTHKGRAKVPQNTSFLEDKRT